MVRLATSQDALSPRADCQPVQNDFDLTDSDRLADDELREIDDPQPADHKRGRQRLTIVDPPWARSGGPRRHLIADIVNLLTDIRR